MNKETPDKWRKVSQDNQFWNSKKARSVQHRESEVIIKYLTSLNLSRYDILEIGCGNGYVGLCICRYFKENDIKFTYHFTDLLDECVHKTQETLESFKLKDAITCSVLDIFNADHVISKGSQAVIISTGFASAATYKSAVPTVAKFLKKEGVLIADFVNNMSPPLFIRHPIKSISRIWSLDRDAKSSESKYYHFGILGIRRYFKMHGLNLVKSRSIGLMKNPIICMFKKTR